MQNAKCLIIDLILKDIKSASLVEWPNPVVIARRGPQQKIKQLSSEGEKSVKLSGFKEPNAWADPSRVLTVSTESFLTPNKTPK